MDTKNKLFLMITGIISLILITVGLSYAFFTAQLTGGEEEATITVTGGTMNIIYNGGPDINITNIIPSNNVITTKTFTVTGNNTTDIEMQYRLSLAIVSNTFSENALKYKLLSTNTDNNGSIVPSINILTNIGSGTKIIELGIGNFTSPTEGNKIHTYQLEIYFPNADYNQNIDQGKEIQAYIRIVNAYPDEQYLKEAVLNQEGGASVIEAKGVPDFSKIAVSQNTYDSLPPTSTPPNASKATANVENGLYASEDEYGISYYYRGDKNLLNNNLIFAGFQWKIIRINGDGSIRIIYNGTESQFNERSIVNTTGDSTRIEIGKWNLNNNDVKYLGYMYGGVNGVASTSRTEAVSNETSSNAKTILETWYQNNILGKEFEQKIIDNLFCNDRQLRNEIGGDATGLGYGLTTTYYAAYYRLYEKRIPTLKCNLKNDRFTINDTNVGNGALTYPVGLITADEAVMAGLMYYTINTNNYLHTNEYYWTFSPGYANTYVLVWHINPQGPYNLDVAYPNEAAFRPVLNISSIITVTGNGSATNPYRVV